MSITLEQFNRTSAGSTKIKDLRDKFAMRALNNREWPNGETDAQCAKRCYEMADAMLAARKIAPFTEDDK